MPKWTRPSNPPPPIFVGTPENNFQKQVAKEVTEFVFNQQILYFAVDVEKTNWHPLYKEAIHKVFYQPVLIKVLVDFEDNESTSTKNGHDRKRRASIHFAKRRLTEDQNLFVRPGDLIFLDDVYYEILTLTEPEELWGQIEHKVGITANCVSTRNPPEFSPI